MKPKPILCLALVLSGGMVGCTTNNQQRHWPVFHGCDGGPTQLFISREPQVLSVYTNGIPDWNYDLRIPAAKIISAEMKYLGAVDGLRVVEVHLTLADVYFTDAVMILQEVESGRFLPVYVQDYNRHIRSPSADVIVKAKNKLVVQAGMDYAGTGHFHSQYKITISPNRAPVVAEPGYCRRIN